jgi:dihydroorotase
MLKKSRVNKGTFENLPDKILLKNILVVDKSEKLNSKMSVVIQNGKIADMLDKAPASFDGETWEDKNFVLMPGFFDMHVHFREPGREDEETLETGSFTAANGGFTGVACMPNTDPAIDSQEVVNFICEETKDFLVDVHPVAAVTKGREGKQLAPIAEMVEAGAIAISDDGSPIMNAELMRRALEYSKMFDIPILGHEEDSNLSKNRHMHEGFYSTKLGIQGIPALSEEIMVARDIMLTEFTGGRFHVCHISSQGSVELVRQAKAKDLKVTCEVTPHHFTLTDQVVESYDTNTKMNPPLRSDDDRQAIIDGLKDGTIDAIATDHAPHSIEEKEAEYIYAPFGITGLETALGLIISQLLDTKVLKLTDIYDLCVKSPRKILNLDVPRIKTGENANLTLFNQKENWIYDDSVSFSKSQNTPFKDHPLSGRNVVVINNGRIFKTPPLK